MNDIINYLTRHGFTAKLENETVIVKDPVYRCGSLGLLILCGYNDVRISDMQQAYRFVSVRN